MTAQKAAWTAFIIGAALILAFHFLQSTQTASQGANAGDRTPPATRTTTTAAPGGQSAPAEPAQAPAPPQTPDAGGAASAGAGGVDRGNGFAQVSPDAAQAPVRPGAVQYERQDIVIPAVPVPDMQDPVAVASAFLTVYNSRTSETDKSWEGVTTTWLVPDLASQLPLVLNGALQGKTPAAVRTVEVGENVEEWGIDTPLRWAHHVQVSVDTEDQGSYVLEYRVRSQLTEQGWLINAAPLDSWQRVES